jgi:hypothetical protein
LPEIADLKDRLNASLGVEAVARAGERGARMALDGLTSFLTAIQHAAEWVSIHP